MSRTLISLIVVSFFSLPSAFGQWVGAGAQFGIGLHGGAGICSSYRGYVPEGIIDIEDDEEDLITLKAELRTDLRDAKADLKDLEGKRGKIASRKEWIERVFKPHVAEGVLKHIGDGLNTRQYYNLNNCNDENSTLRDNQPWEGFCPAEGSVPTELQRVEATSFIASVSDVEPGKFDGEACSKEATLIRKDKKVSGYAKGQCKRGIDEYRELLDEQNLLNARVSELEDQIDGIDEQLKDLKREKRRVAREAQREQTEGTYCYKCHRPNDKPISTTEKVGSLLLGGLGAYLGYKGYKYGVDQAAKLGWPVAANPAVVMGGILPSVSMGIYGATNGFGAGGCGAGSPLGMYGPGGLYGTGLYPQTGGAFGYPAGLGGAMGGGLYMPGMGTWGMNGPWGGGLYPGMGVPMAGGYPIAGGGYLVGGIGGVGFISGGGSMLGGIPGAIGYIGSGIPMAGGAIMGGGAIGAGGGLMGFISGGYPIGGSGGYIPGGIGYIGGFPVGGGGGIFGMIGGAIPGSSIGVPIGGYIGGGIPGGIPGGGFGYVGGGIPGGGMAALQYQQQMMQMQQQQMQAWIQSQQRAQQDYYNRQQTVSQLQSQLVQIQMQIQQVQFGVYGSGYSSGGGAGGVLPYPGQQAPYPGGPGYQPGFPGQQPYPGSYATPPYFPNQPGGGTSARGGR